MAGQIGISFLRNLYCPFVLQLIKGTKFTMSVVQVFIFLVSFCMCIKYTQWAAYLFDPLAELHTNI